MNSHFEKELKPLIVILGPTASGKTRLGIELAKQFHGEVVSCDSRQIYREMNIGTAKVRGIWENNQFMVERIPHHMIDIKNSDEEFTVQEYKTMAIDIIRDIQNRGKLPFLIGGTGLYINAVVDNLEIPKVPPNRVLREKLEKKSAEDLFQDLKRIDPEHAKQTSPANKRRLIRAIEVTLLSGKSFSSQQKKGKPLFRILMVGIKLSKEELYQNIDERTEEQFETGLENEVRTLKEKYGCEIPAMTGICYREMCEYLNGKISLDEARQKIKTNNRRYARRQLVWFKRDSRIHWIEDIKEAEKHVQEFLRTI